MTRAEAERVVVITRRYRSWPLSGQIVHPPGRRGRPPVGLPGIAEFYGPSWHRRCVDAVDCREGDMKMQKALVQTVGFAALLAVQAIGVAEAAAAQQPPPIQGDRHHCDRDQHRRDDWRRPMGILGARSSACCI